MKKRVRINNVQYLLLDWKEIDTMIDELSDRVRKNSCEPTLIVGVLRGGAIVASLLSDRLDIHNVRVVGARVYQRTGKIGEKVDIYQPLPMADLQDYHVLFVDDVVDTGTTYTTILKDQIYPKKPRSLCTISLHIKPWAKTRPDLYLEETNCWIWYPWELYEVERDVYGDLLKDYDLETAKNILLTKLRLNRRIVDRGANSLVTKTGDPKT